jgi:hypothetical protein
MELIIPCAIAFVLFLLLFLATPANATADESILDEESLLHACHTKAQCPPQLVQRLFSRADWEFIANLHSAPLLRIFRKERKAVAVRWARQISSEISRAMQEHTRAARRSADLKVASELQLFFRFAGLRLLCVLLVVLIGFADLHTLAGLATKMSQLAAEFLSTRPALEVKSHTTASSTFDTL